jgi:hypothetical protein
MGAVTTLEKYPFGKKPDATDAVALLEKIHGDVGAALSSLHGGRRSFSAFEQELLVEALTQIDHESKARKRAEQELADYRSGNLAGAPVADALSYRATVSSRDAAGDLRTVEFIPSDASAQAYRIKVASRDAAGDLKAIDLVPLPQGAK